MTVTEQPAGGPGWRGPLAAWTDDTRHLYVSCACLHGFHDQCGTLQHERGDAGAPHCKFCPATCACRQCGHDTSQETFAARAFYRGYQNATGKLSVQVKRLHIIREDGRWAGRQGMCGTALGAHRQSQPVILDPMPATPPAGLSWCPACVGLLADRAGLIDVVAALLAAQKAVVAA